MAEFCGAASAFFAQYDVLWRVVVVIVACLVAQPQIIRKRLDREEK